MDLEEETPVVECNPLTEGLGQLSSNSSNRDEGEEDSSPDSEMRGLAISVGQKSRDHDHNMSESYHEIFDTQVRMVRRNFS